MPQAAAPRGGDLPVFPSASQYSGTTEVTTLRRPPSRGATNTPAASVQSYQQVQRGHHGPQVDPRYSSQSRRTSDQSIQHRPPGSTRIPSHHSQPPPRLSQYDQRNDPRQQHPSDELQRLSLASQHSNNSQNSVQSSQRGGRRPVMGIQPSSSSSAANLVGQPFGIAPENPHRGVPYDRVLWNIFCQVDSDGSGAITQAELGHALINGDFTAFDVSTVNLMIRLFDEDRNGTISFNEFEKLWKYLLEWRTIFTRFDVDSSGTISFPEFSDALAAFGYRLSTTFVQFLFRYHDKSRTKEMSFDLFVQSCVTLKMFTDVFKKFDTDQDGVITIGFEDFLQVMIRNR